MCFPATLSTGVRQENVRPPSTCTMHAPHWPAPQPYFVPVSLSSSRSTHRSGVPCAAALVTALPLTVKWMAMRPSPRGRANCYTLPGPRNTMGTMSSILAPRARPIIPFVAPLYRALEPYAYTLIRAASGAIFIPHGVQKLVLGSYAVGALELAAGLAVAHGLLTRPAAV